MGQARRNRWSRLVSPALVFVGIGTMVAAGLVTALRAQTTASHIVWACDRYPDEVSTKEGNCSIDGSRLEPVILDSEWTCPEHQAIAQDEPGKCPIDKRDLVKVAVTRYYTCPQSVLHELDPGNCADGELRVEVKHRLKEAVTPPSGGK
jgi:hypothetical protein